MHPLGWLRRNEIDIPPRPKPWQWPKTSVLNSTMRRRLVAHCTKELYLPHKQVIILCLRPDPLLIKLLFQSINELVCPPLNPHGVGTSTQERVVLYIHSDRIVDTSQFFVLLS